MFDLNQNHPILESVEKIYVSTKGSLLSTETLQKCEKEVKVISDFLKCTSQEAVLLSILIQSQLKEKQISVKLLLEHTQLRIPSAITLNELLKPLVQRGWLSPRKDYTLYPLTEYGISGKLMRSILSGKLITIEADTIANSFDLLSKFQSKVDERYSKKINFEQLLDSTQTLLEENKSIDLSDFIANQSLSKEDTTYFMFVCLQHYMGNEHCDVDQMIRELKPSSEAQYRLRKAFKSGNHSLLKSGLLKESELHDFFAHRSSFVLSEKSLRALDKEATMTTNFEPENLSLLKPEKIKEKTLIFDNELKKSVEKMQQILHPEHYGSLISRLEHEGMKKGITILLYGQPGTGKTELVYQLAKATNRMVLAADASKIKSKWVGDTAKNVRALFEEYRTAVNELEATPILLFNEADAIIGKRHVVNDRGDQEMNTMQNILLEELEIFEGIFMATTNLTDNLDAAFDRRFLYKVKFDMPEKETVIKIWRNKFPELSQAIIRKIDIHHTLTGAQIENIRKKVSVDRVLNAKVKMDKAYLESLIHDELSLNNKNIRKSEIGFIRRA